MKVYRGYDKKVGPISYAHWTYVTPDIEQAKWYATKDGDIEDGGIIEYDLDVDNLRFISLDKLNSFAQDESEIYSEEDLLWYQEGLGESLYKYVAGIVFEDPHYKGHTIYIVFSKDHLKNGRVLSKEEFDQLNEELVYAKSKDDQLTDIILKNPTRKELEDNHIERARCMVDGEGNWYFSDMFDTLHFQIEKLLRQNVSFPYYDGHDSYGISYYDVEGNEFWYNPNEIMPREKCVAQYYESPYLRKNFPDAYIRDNPYGFESEDYENENIELTEAVITKDSLMKLRERIVQDIINEGDSEIDNALQDEDLYYTLEDLEKTNPKFFQKLQAEAGQTSIDSLVISVKNDYRSGYLRKTLEYALGKEYDKRMKYLVHEYNENDYIYRSIDSNLDFEDFIKEVETNGIGNCWAKLDENAKAYYGGNMKYNYIVLGESSLKNVNIEETIFLRMVADYEDEIRLLKDAPVRILGITKTTYGDNGYTELENKKYEINKVVSVGSKYVY